MIFQTLRIHYKVITYYGNFMSAVFCMIYQVWDKERIKEFCEFSNIRSYTPKTSLNIWFYTLNKFPVYLIFKLLTIHLSSSSNI